MRNMKMGKIKRRRREMKKILISKTSRIMKLFPIKRLIASRTAKSWLNNNRRGRKNRRASIIKKKLTPKKKK